MEPPGTPTSRNREIEHSCTECRRRKAKCDRSLPQCSNCLKHDRLCSYEKPFKTPLTRKYVVELEQELAEARELLRRSSTPAGRAADQYHFTEQNGNSQSGAEAATATGADPGVNAGPSAEAREISNSHSMFNTAAPRPSMNAPPRSAPSATANTSHTSVPRFVRYASSSQTAKPSPTFSLEAPPASDDFDWDERNIHSNADGMASLTNASSRGGYLGVASGAALLRLADTDSQPASTYNTDDETQGEESIRNTPIPKAIYTLSQLEPFVDAYFSLYHVSYPIVHEATFRAQFMEIIPRPKHKAWHVLLYIIAALGAFTTAESPTDVDVALFQAAKARISIDMLETGNLAFVQALTLISNYVQKRNKPNSGYNYTGLAKRVALGIGLHKEFAIWHTKPLMLEMRRRVWWALYVFDVGACITFSRPLDSPEGGVEVLLPLNVHDTDITASTRQTPEEINEVTLYSHVRCQSQFHIALGPIYARLLSTPFPESKELMDMDDRCIAQWVTDLPDYFKEDVQQPPKYRLCHAILRWRYRNFRILMYRHFVIRHIMLKAQQTNGNQQVHQEVVSHYDNLAIQRCLDAAAQTVDLITTFWQQERRSMMACWYSLYFLFQAILVPVICLRNEPQSIQAMSWRDQIFRASQVIADMANLNPAAVRCHNTITSLCGAYLGQSPSNSAWGEPVQESPQTQLNGLYPFMWPMLDGFQSDSYDSALHESAIHDFMNQISGMQ